MRTAQNSKTALRTDRDLALLPQNRAVQRYSLAVQRGVSPNGGPNPRGAGIVR
jgi:hypothetical protein